MAAIEEVFSSDVSEELRDKRLEEIVESMYDFTEQEIAYLQNL